MESELKKNIYDKTLIALIVLLLFGILGGAFQPIRIFSLIVFCIILPKNVGVLFSRNMINVIVFFLLLIGFSIFSMIWTVDLSEGWKACVYIITHISIFLNIIICFSKGNLPIRSLLDAWFWLIALTIPIAIIELAFDVHLSLSYYDANKVSYLADGTSYIKRFSSVTFGNYNSYVTVLIYSLPFLFGRLIVSRNSSFYFNTIVSIVLVFVILFLNASRGGVFASVFMLFVFVCLDKGEDFRIPLYVKGFLIFVISALLLYSSTLFEQLSYRFAGFDGSFKDKIREALFLDAYEIAKEYYFLGSGSGSLEKLMELRHALINLPHNFFLEFLAQYGIVFLFGILVLIVSIFFKSLVSRMKIFRVVCILAILSFPFLFIINSGYVHQPILWVYFASLYSLAYIR